MILYEVHKINNFVATGELRYKSKAKKRCKNINGRKSPYFMDVYVQDGIKDGKPQEFVVKHDFLNNLWLDEVYLDKDI